MSLPPFPDDLPTAPLVTLSLAKLKQGDASEVAALFKCSKDLGFFYLDLRGTDDGEHLYADAQQLNKLEKQFFDLPQEEKERFDREVLEGGHRYYGYKAIGKAVMDKTGSPDRLETYNLKRDDIVGNTTPLPLPELLKTNLPLFESFARTAHSCVTLMLNLINDSLGLEPGTLAGMHRLTAESGDHVRFIKAPPQPKGYTGMTAPAHTDFGSLTVLFNWLGGLQVVLPGQNKGWVWVRPQPGCAIVNLGDAMVKFSGGLLRSNIHRTVAPPGAQADHPRYSLVYFSRPEDSVVLRRLKGGVIDQQPVSDQPEEEYTSLEWILKRGTANHAAQWKPENWEKSRGTEGNRDE